MANVAEKVRQIRLAQYGKDVRESIASGIEAINEETENTTKVATDKVNEMTALETALNAAEELRETQEEARQTDTSTAVDNVEAVQAEVERKLAAGEFMGPRPDHEWNGYSIRFKMGDGSWGVWTDLRGPMGPAGSIENASASDIATSSGFNVQAELDELRDKANSAAYVSDDVIVDNSGNQYGLIETGTVGPLTYYKYADGRLTYVVNATTTATITTANGGIYISAIRSMATYTYPVPFVAIPVVTANVGGNGHTSYCWIAITDNLAVRDAPPDYYICRGSADADSKSYRVGMIIEGRWK